jgi:limonene-1,2-epoxide hydrolase
MFKYVFIIVNSVVLLFFGLYSGDNGITVSSNIPATLVAGQEIAIELKVRKGGMNGFAKLQLELPEGIVVKEAEDKGANYNYSAGTAKWVWPALPTESEIVVRLTLFIENSVLGSKTFGAKYSYVENNVKQVVEMEPVEVNVLPPGSEASLPLAATTEQDTAKPVTTVSSQPVSTAKDPDEQISVTREISAGAGENEFLITVRIKKNGTKGFARYSDDLADGVIVKSARTDGGSFSVSDGKIKFVWVNVPEKDELEIAYTMSGTTASAVMLAGEYSYLEDNQSKKYRVPMETIAFQTRNQTITETPVETPSQKTEPAVVTTEKKDPETVSPATVESVERAVAKKLSENTIEKTLSKKSGSLAFEVQVGAFTKSKVTAAKLKKKFSIGESVRSEMHDGYVKFLTGSFSDYKNARNQRETIKTVNGVKSAFVVAYNQGSRITVQEALMITNQKWFK